MRFEDSAADNGKILTRLRSAVRLEIYLYGAASKQQWGDPSDRESVLAFWKYLEKEKKKKKKGRKGRLMRESGGK